jgi:predicted nucleic acid-binding protein
LTAFVVDASVAIKWVLPEIHSDAARRLLVKRPRLSAPDLIWAEAGNIVWKRWRKGEVPEATSVLRDIRELKLEIQPSEPLMDAAWEVASAFNRSFYDSLYLALAIREGCMLVTADLRLYNALRGSTLASRLLWIADVP